MLSNAQAYSFAGLEGNLRPYGFVARIISLKPFWLSRAPPGVRQIETWWRAKLLPAIILVCISSWLKRRWSLLLSHTWRGYLGQLGIGWCQEMAISLEMVISHEGRKRIFSESHSKTQLASQLLGGVLWERVRSLDPLANIKSGAGVRVVIWGLSLKRQFFLWRRPGFLWLA